MGCGAIHEVPCKVAGFSNRIRMRRQVRRTGIGKGSNSHSHLTESGVKIQGSTTPYTSLLLNAAFLRYHMACNCNQVPTVRGCSAPSVLLARRTEPVVQLPDPVTIDPAIPIALCGLAPQPDSLKEGPGHLNGCTLEVWGKRRCLKGHS